MQNETIVCVAPRDWHGPWKESQSIMSRIAIHDQVIYFDPGHDSQSSTVGEMVGNLPNFFALQTERVQKNITVISSPSVLRHARRHLPCSVLPATVPIMVRINTQILIRHMRRAIQALDPETNPGGPGSTRGRLI